MKRCGAGLAAVLTLAFVLVAGSGSLFAQYESADCCIDYHDEQSNQWLTSGHRFILMEGQDARHRELPLPEGLGWDGIDYVVEGNKTRALFLNDEGFLYTPSRGDNQ